MKVHAITFGDGHPLMRSAAYRLMSQALGTGWFESVSAFGLSTLETFPQWYNQHSNFILNNSRGFGYWLWKPFLIWQSLLRTPKDDLVLYMDAGCEINATGFERYKRYVKLANEYLLFGMETTDSLELWTKRHVLNYFGIKQGDIKLDQPMRESGFIFIRSSPATRSFFRELSLICSDLSYSLIDDSPSRDSELERFKEHRHDQSIYTLLTYERSIGCFLLASDEYYFAENWNAGQHPTAYPFAAMRNKSGKSRLMQDGSIGPYQPAYFAFIEDQRSKPKCD